jgi:hypothetical protein
MLTRVLIFGLRKVTYACVCNNNNNISCNKKQWSDLEKFHSDFDFPSAKLSEIKIQEKFS